MYHLSKKKKVTKTPIVFHNVEWHVSCSETIAYFVTCQNIFASQCV